MGYGMASPSGYKGSTGGNNGMNSGKDPWDVFRGIKHAESNSQSGPEGYQQGKIQQFDKRQTQLYNQNFEHLGPDSYLSRLAGGDESLYADMEAPALRQFSELQGGIASRFSGQGMGGRRSSGFQNTMSAANSDFAQQLQSNRQSLRSQAIKDLMGMSNDLLNQRPSENYLVPEQMSWEESMGLGLMNGLGGAASSYAGGRGYAAGGG
jgi:hypothetical protein